MKLTKIVKTSKGYVLIDTCFTLDHGWETIVFACDENGKVDNWQGLDVDIYGSQVAAENGHWQMVEKWQRK